MDRQGRPDEPQLVYRRDPETGRPVEGLLRWGLIPHFCEKRPDFAPIHARGETVAEKEWFRRLSDEADPRELLASFPADELAVSPQRSRRWSASRPDEPHSVDSRRVELLDDYPMRGVFAALGNSPAGQCVAWP